MAASQIVVAVTPDGGEYYEEVVYPLPRITCSNICMHAVLRAKLTTSRLDPVVVKVTLFRLVVKDGDLGRELLDVYEVMPPLTDPSETEYEFGLMLKSVMQELPFEFRDLAYRLVRDRQQRDGYQTAANFAKSFSSLLNASINKFCEATTRSHQP